MHEHVLPSRDDPLVRGASEIVGGPAGRRVRFGRGPWTPLRVLLGMVVAASGLGLLLDQPCRADAWTGGDQYVAGCYSDIAHLYRTRGLAEGRTPYFDAGPLEEQVEYPVLTGAVMAAVATAVGEYGDDVDRARRFFDINALLLALWAAVTVFATARLAGRRPWDAAMVALAPGLVLTGTINWDLWAVGLTALAMLAWARERPLLAGALLGLGTAMKFYPLLLLGPLFVLCLRGRRLTHCTRTALVAGATWLAVNIPVLLVAPEGWRRFYQLSRERGADFGSVWYWLQGIGRGVPPEALNTVASGLFLVCCLGVAALTLLAPRRPRLPQVVFLTLAAFLVTNKVYSPQYVLWLIPLAALARPRWRDFLVWQAAEVLYFFAIWWHIQGFTNPDRALPDRYYWAAVLLHVAATLYLGAFVVRDIWRPEHDPVRADGSDDPAGGVLDGAPDAAWRPAPRAVPAYPSS